MEKTKIKREFSAGGVVYRRDPSTSSGQETLWLVVKPLGSEKWRLPKGWIEPGESSLEAARREVREEVGIEVEVLGKIGTEKYFFVQDKQKILKTVVFYLMEYLQEAQTGFSWETEAIDWLSYEKAQKRLAFEKEREILGKAKELLGKE